MLHPRSGYTLPVFACAAAIAALRWLRDAQPLVSVSVDLLEPAQTIEIPIAQVARLKPGVALAITYSDPGDNLDLTRNTPIWAMVEIVAVENVAETMGIGGEAERLGAMADSASYNPYILLKGGEGIGRQTNADGQAAIYRYAKNLLLENLERWRSPDQTIQVTIILPEGRALAARTSNAAFGIVEGLSLLGTSGIAQPLSAPGQLEIYREELQAKAKQFDCLVFCVGENGLDLAQKLGIEPERLIKTANWLGSLLVEAGLQQVKQVLLFGYHGKLIKLAGGIFHTHHHVADGRLETLTAHCASQGLPTPDLQAIFASATTEDGLQYLSGLDARTGSHWVDRVYGAIAATLDQRSQAYIYTHSGQQVTVGSILFDRNRKILVKSEKGLQLLQQIDLECS